MTREEALNKFYNADTCDEARDFINKIYDHHEAQVKKLNKEIERLKREGTR